MKKIMKAQSPILPPHWREEVRPPSHIQRAFRNIYDLLVIITDEEHYGKVWRHASCSRHNRLPTWEELREVKDIFVGVNRNAIQVFPPKNEYINDHPYVLHLWGVPEGDDPLPDFRILGSL